FSSRRRHTRWPRDWSSDVCSSDLLTRNVGSILMDLNGVEHIAVNALGGIDNVTINDLTGTDATLVTVDLAGTPGGASADGSIDQIGRASCRGSWMRLVLVLWYHGI